MSWSAQTVEVTLPNGTSVEVEKDAPFAQTLKDVARQAGLTRFRVYDHESDEEITPKSAPSTITDPLRLEADDVAG